MRFTTTAVLWLGTGLVLAGCSTTDQTSEPPLTTLPTATALPITVAPITLAPTPCIAGCAPEGGPGITAAPTPVDEAGWVPTSANDPKTWNNIPTFGPAMPAMTAELALQISPALSSLHLSPAVPTAYWSQSQCDWLSDTMYADALLDQQNGTLTNLYDGNLFAALWYSNKVDEWRFIAGIAERACWHGIGINGEQAATAIRDAMGNGWNGHVAHYATDAPGSFQQFWDRAWPDAYQEIATLFAQVPEAPLYFCLQNGWGDAVSSQCTAASVLTSLGVRTS